ncbi:pleckstrin homology domain-containing family A member 6 isoform X3 [Alosa sapidissima]|uniref:pleckstrin homology domain-containing family A member 6 isoform X3 n=1 Tax=Alosa sapidissima TaxID=34773 RepID=UPI001C0997B1|nr:pleckstrin homology domain-containing family A member 6 isoform X3 [Alosa sapidissima]
MLKFRADRRVSQNDQNGPPGHPVIQSHLEESVHLQKSLSRNSALDMNGKAGRREPENGTAGTSANVNASAGQGNANGNNIAMMTEAQPDTQPPLARVSRTSRKAATFGKRSNSMRRNPKAEVTKQGWLHKQASSGVKQWNRRWFVLTDRCLFYYKDEKEEGVLGSLPMLSFHIGPVQPADNVSRKYAFKVWYEDEVEQDGTDSKGSIAFCLQVEHPGTRTYYFSADCQEEQEEWVKAMSDAASVQVSHTPSRSDSELTPSEEQNYIQSPREPVPETNGQAVATQRLSPSPAGARHQMNGGHNADPTAEARAPPNRPPHRPQQPNGWGNYGTPGSPAYPPQAQQQQEGQRPESVVLRRSIAPRSAPEKMAQRKSSMTQLQQWVNQRRGMATQEDLRSPSRYYPGQRAMPDYYAGYGGPQYVEEYPLYPPGIRPDSICSASAAYEQRWTAEEKRRSLRDGGAMFREAQWHPAGPPPAAYYGHVDPLHGSMRRLSIQPRSRSVPRSPSSSVSGGPYSPGPHLYASPLRSPSIHFGGGGPGRHRDDIIYADPSAYGLRRSISSPKYDYPGDRQSISQGIYPYNYPASPALHNKMDDILDLQLQRNLEYLDQQVTEGDHLISMVTRMVERTSSRPKLFSQVPPFHDVYRDLHPTLKLNEMETSKLLGRLCEQHRVMKEQETVVHRLRMDKDNLEEALVATHQEMEMYRSQALTSDKLQMKKETLQSQLIKIRGELSQASSALTSTRVEFEALEDEVNAIHGDLWEQLNAGGQSELVHRHIQKEFWRVQDVLEGLHKNNLSRGTDTAKHRVTSGASGSFSTNSPASPLSSVSLTSPLSPFSPVSGSQMSPTKQTGSEDIGPPRPPLPKSYLPLETSPTAPPSVPPLPSYSSAWHSSSIEDPYRDDDDGYHGRKQRPLSGDKTSSNDQYLEHTSVNKVGIVPPLARSPGEEQTRSSAPIHRRNGKVSNGHISRERPKSAVFPAEVKSKMSVEEQNERIRRNLSSSVRDKRRSLNLSGSQLDGSKPSYRVVRRRLTAHEVDIKDLEAAVRGEGVETPREEIARLRRLQMEPQHYDLDISKELLAPEKILIPERYLDAEPSKPLSPEEMREKQKKVERIKTLIAKSNLQNVVPQLDGPVESQPNPDQQLQEQEKRIEISCALAAEASRRSRLLSAQCGPSPPASPTSPAPPPSAEFSDSSHIMKV